MKWLKSFFFSCFNQSPFELEPGQYFKEIFHTQPIFHYKKKHDLQILQSYIEFHKDKY